MYFFPDSVLPQSEGWTQPCNWSLPSVTLLLIARGQFSEESYGKWDYRECPGDQSGCFISTSVLSIKTFCTSGQCTCGPTPEDTAIAGRAMCPSTNCGQSHDVRWSKPQQGAAERDSDVDSAAEEQELPTHYSTFTYHPPGKRRPVEAAYADKGFLAAEVILILHL